MNIIAIRLVLVGTKPGLIVTCKILTVVVTFLFMRILILLSLAVTRHRVQLMVQVLVIGFVQNI